MEKLSTKNSNVENGVKQPTDCLLSTSTERGQPGMTDDVKIPVLSSPGVVSVPSFFTSVAEVRPGQHNVNCLVRVLRLLAASSRPLYPLASTGASPICLSFYPCTGQPSSSHPLSCTDLAGDLVEIPGSAKAKVKEDAMLVMYEFLVADHTGSVKLVTYGRRHCAVCKVGAVVAVTNAVASVVDEEVFLDVFEKAGGDILQTSISEKAFPVSELPCISDVPVVPLRSALPTGKRTT